MAGKPEGSMLTEEKLRMSVKEAGRLGIMRQMDKKDLTPRRAAEELGLSLKQLRRVRKRYLAEGEAGLLSRKRGQVSGNKIPGKIRDKVISLVRAKYIDFGPTLAREKLLERDKLQLSRETLRSWMTEEGIWVSRKKKDKRVYQRRPRRSQFGALLQGDGSHHDWFEGRGEKCCLIHFIDDATNEITSAKFSAKETTEAYLVCLKEHLEQYGRPLGFYVDKHGTFKVNREELKKGIGITHFGKVLKELDIELICAHSPQAKGRIERSNGVLQDRLIKEIRLEGISTIEQANAFLPRFLEKHNKRFRKEAVNLEDAHRAMRQKDDLERIFARKDKRKLSKDLTFQHHGILYLIETKTPNRLRYASVDVLWKDDQPITVEYEGKNLKYKVYEERIYEQPRVLDSKEIGVAWVSKKPMKPSRHHPWR
jgi:transposase InsO family protein